MGKILLWGLSLFFLLTSCKKEKNTEEITEVAATQKTEQETIDCGAFCNPPEVTYVLPDDACNLSSQKTMNCFAWSSFLALNWKAGGQGVPDSTATALAYGTPGDFSPTVWESCPSVDDIFSTQGKSLKALNPLTSIKRINKLSKIGLLLSKVNKKSLKASKDSKLEEIFQAKGTWLTDQGGNLVWYEVRVDMTEADFINANQLYTTANLKNYASQHNGVWLPTGSIEFKAAWKVVPEKEVDSVQKYYKMSQALVPTVTGFDADNQPIYGKYTQQYLALVGLHIIRKTSLASQFVWMTFEHIHNAPTAGQVDDSVSYSFFNPSSTAIPNRSPVPNKDSLSTPVQVVRIANNALTTDIQTLNAQVQDLIRQSNPQSVWQYYQLVNVQWPQNPVQDGNNNKQIPLQMGGITPSNIANTTMETYAQSTQCMSCHQYGSINGTQYPTDYSFVFLQVKQ